MSEKVFNIIFSENEVTWQSLLVELVKSEGMDPWDIDVSELAKKYISMVKEMQKTDLRISGKVLLAASILLRIKSQHFLEDDIVSFDNMMYESEDDMEYYEDGSIERQNIDRSIYKKLKLIPKTPQPRKRKVSVYDLVNALQQALEVNKRRTNRIPEVVSVEIPKKKTDISELMGNVYNRIVNFFNNNEKIKFSQLVPDTSKEGKIFTFIPLLHLSNQRKIDLYQEKAFDDFDIMLNQNHNKIMKELGEQKA